MIARYEEDEFLILLGGCDARGALATGLRMSAEIRQQTFQHQKAELKASVSMGVASCPEHGRTPGILFEGAQAALHEAQEKGEGQCLLYDHAMKKVEPHGVDVDRF